MVSNEALTALKWFPFPGGAKSDMTITMWCAGSYDALYEMNMDCDFVSTRRTETCAL